MNRKSPIALCFVQVGLLRHHHHDRGVVHAVAVLRLLLQHPAGHLLPGGRVGVRRRLPRRRAQGEVQLSEVPSSPRR